MSNLAAASAFERVVASLGRPYFRNDRVALFHGNCAESLRAVPSGTANLIVTSPPYNIGKSYEEVMPLEKYIEWCESWMTRLFEAAAMNASFWLNLGYLEVKGKGRAVPIPYLLWNKSPFYLLQEVVWNYGAGVASRVAFSPRNEKFLWYVKDIENYVFNLDDVRDPDVKYPNQKKNGKLKCNPLGKNPSDVWQFPKVTSGENRASAERTDHPAQFPVAVVERILRACSNKDDLILDPFMGSGSTAEAAIKCDRYAIGIEINESYLRTAAARISAFSSRESIRRSQIELALGK